MITIKKSISKINNLIILCNSNYELHIFLKISNSLKLLGIKSDYVTIKPSIYFSLKIKGYDVFLINKTSEKIRTESISSLQKLSEIYISREDISNIYSNVYMYFWNLFNNLKYDAILIWNGMGILSLPAAVIAKKMKIPQLYFELSNIPDKIFIDPKGVNAQSFLFDNIDILDRFLVDNESYEF